METVHALRRHIVLSPLAIEALVFVESYVAIPLYANKLRSKFFVFVHPLFNTCMPIFLNISTLKYESCVILQTFQVVIPKM